MIDTSEATAIVESLFRWLYDEPLTNPERQRMQLSMIANIVCTSYQTYAPYGDCADISCQPLSDAYHRAKRQRGIT